MRHALVDLIRKGDLPALGDSLISVTEVAMTPDLKLATAYVSLLGGGDAAPVVEALNAHSRFIRGRLTPALARMKTMPKVRFRADTSFDNYRRIDELLASPAVARDLVDDEDGESK